MRIFSTLEPIKTAVGASAEGAIENFADSANRRLRAHEKLRDMTGAKANSRRPWPPGPGVATPLNTKITCVHENLWICHMP